MADRNVFARSAYADGRHLTARQSLYRWQRPSYDLAGILLKEITETKGIVPDVGCGNGRFLGRLREDRPDLLTVGMDISAGNGRLTCP